MTRVVLTHPEPRVARIAEALRARGHEVAVLSTQRLTPCEPADGLEKVLDGADWAVLVSPGAVDAALGLLRGRWPASVGAAVIGPGSARALAAHGVRPPGCRVVHPSVAPYDADALMRQAPFDRPAGLRVVVLRGERGRTDWIERLRERGATVSAACVYRTDAVAPASEGVARLEAWQALACEAVFVFSSADGIAGTEAALGAHGWLGWARGQRALAQHPRLAGLLRGSGWRRTIEIGPGEPALVAAIESA